MVVFVLGLALLQQGTPPPPGAAPAVPPAVDPDKLTDCGVTVHDAKVGTVVLVSLGQRRRSQEEYLLIPVLIDNTSKVRKLNYRTWRGEGIDSRPVAARLEDEHGNHYRPILLEVDGVPLEPVQGVREASIYPLAVQTDLLVFEPPVGAATRLTLTLPRAALGGKGEISVPFQKSGREWRVIGSAPPPTRPPPKPPRPMDATPAAVGERVTAGDLMIVVDPPRLEAPRISDGTSERGTKALAVVAPITIVNRSSSKAAPFTNPVWNDDSAPPDGHVALFGASGRPAFSARRITPPWRIAGSQEVETSIPPLGALTIMAPFEPAAASTKSGDLTLALPLTRLGQEGTFRALIHQSDLVRPDTKP